MLIASFTMIAILFVSIGATFAMVRVYLTSTVHSFVFNVRSLVSIAVTLTTSVDHFANNAMPFMDRQVERPGASFTDLTGRSLYTHRRFRDRDRRPGSADRDSDHPTRDRTPPDPGIEVQKPGSWRREPGLALHESADRDGVGARRPSGQPARVRRGLRRRRSGPIGPRKADQNAADLTPTESLQPRTGGFSARTGVDFTRRAVWLTRTGSS